MLVQDSKPLVTDGNGELNRPDRKPLNRFMRILLIIIGTLSLCLATIGIFLPLLPTTPFLVLTVACYVRSSDRLYRWLLGKRFFSKYLRNIIERKGMRLRSKVIILVFAWLLFILLGLFVLQSLVFRIILVVLGIIKTIVIISLKTLKDEPKITELPVVLHTDDE